MDKNKLSAIKEHIQKVYKTYGRPFIVGYSGGKDSTATMQIIWEALAALPRVELKYDIHVICTDTLVEQPYIVQYINDILKKINETAQEQSLPIYAHKLEPLLEKSFWVNLIGRGYPAPSQQFRWCTERLKIDPVNRFIEEQVGKFKEATVVLGARSEESASRQQVLSKKKRDPLGLSKHPTLPEAYVFTPIEKLTTDEVWGYLLSNKPPWGGSNRDLSAMYKNASSGECPMVVDKSTPSCGSSRFGCWICTLVQKDTSMENLIDNGEEWMTPLLEFRELLKETQDPAKKKQYRSHKRRDGKIKKSKEDTDYIPGPYKAKWRKEFLKQLLEIQKSINDEKPELNFKILGLEELELIRQLWQKELHDWEDTVPALYKEVMGLEFPLLPDDGVFFTTEDHKLLEQHCENEMQVELIARLLDLERSMEGMTRRSGILQQIDRLMNEDWHSEQELLKEIQTKEIEEPDDYQQDCAG